MTGRQERRRKYIPADFRRKMVLELEIGRTGSHFVKKSFLKGVGRRLRLCKK